MFNLLFFVILFPNSYNDIFYVCPSIDQPRNENQLVSGTIGSDKI